MFVVRIEVCLPILYVECVCKKFSAIELFNFKLKTNFHKLDELMWISSFDRKSGNIDEQEKVLSTTEKSFYLLFSFGWEKIAKIELHDLSCMKVLIWKVGESHFTKNLMQDSSFYLFIFISIFKKNFPFERKKFLQSLVSEVSCGCLFAVSCNDIFFS